MSIEPAVELRTQPAPVRGRWLIRSLPLFLLVLVLPGCPLAISSDPYTNGDAQHQTQVEPAASAYGSTIVAAFQSGRFADASGHATNIDWATSVDGGTTWRRGSLPGLTVNATPPGSAARATDPSVAYDARHHQWLITSLLLEMTQVGRQEEIAVSRSPDGTHWSSPQLVAQAAGYDKEWITCDNSPSSPRAGRCYVAWDVVAGASSRVLVSASSDGGVSWQAPVTALNTFGAGAQPLVQPDGTLVIAMASIPNFVAVRSTDGGASFSAATPIASLAFHRPAGGFRAGPLPTAVVDSLGRIYVAWSGCPLRTACNADDVLMSTSQDGRIWTAPVRVPIGAANAPVDHLLPALAVDTSSIGGPTRLALTFYAMDASCAPAACQLTVGSIRSSDGGSTWALPRLEIPSAMSLAWLPNSDAGLMVGDYTATVFAQSAQPGCPAGASTCERPVAVFPVAGAPAGPAAFHETIDSDVLPP